MNMSNFLDANVQFALIRDRYEYSDAGRSNFENAW